ncbi:hypothetical protein [Terrarubrum flagellatum]|uniref:hypothetical protein n=1 Tax=Terrirubrum flagellatum TaxID=2895980 RepID=UPI0031452F77
MPTDYRRARAVQDRLQDEHRKAMERLCEAITNDRNLGLFGDLADDVRAEIVSAATAMCEAWDNDEAVREGYEFGANHLIDLVAQQYQIAQAIRAAEERRIALIGSAPRYLH